MVFFKEHVNKLSLGILIQSRNGLRDNLKYVYITVYDFNVRLNSTV